MRILLFIFLLALNLPEVFSQTRTIHVFVALCDNENQGIVPVPKTLGNGKDPANNLYWGAAYGIKTFLKNRAADWQLVKTYPSGNSVILERLLFKHATEDVYLLADAYDGEKIRPCIINFLEASNNQNPLKIQYDEKYLMFGGGSDLLAYVGHDGLMDFTVDVSYNKDNDKKKDIIILACYSRLYFKPEIEKSGATPLLWTTHLMAPEAYTLEAAIAGWILKEPGNLIEERAAQTYHKYQKCGINGARNLFSTGF